MRRCCARLKSFLILRTSSSSRRATARVTQQRPHVTIVASQDTWLTIASARARALAKVPREKQSCVTSVERKATSQLSAASKVSRGSILEHNGILVCNFAHCGFGCSYRCHDLRRGHAKDMQLNGATLYEILAAGEWKSPAFLDYMSLMELETGAVIEAHQAESSSEDEE